MSGSGNGDSAGRATGATAGESTPITMPEGSRAIGATPEGGDVVMGTEEYPQASGPGAEIPSTDQITDRESASTSTHIPVAIAPEGSAAAPAAVAPKGVSCGSSSTEDAAAPENQEKRQPQQLTPKTPLRPILKPSPSK